MSHLVDGLLLGLFLGYVGCVVIESYRGNLKRRHWQRRKPPEGTARRRDLPQQARALAFATLYEFCGSDTYQHFVLEQDRQRLIETVRAYLRENRDRLSEWHFGFAAFEAQEEKLAESTVDTTIRLFLQI